MRNRLPATARRIAAALAALLLLSACTGSRTAAPAPAATVAAPAPTAVGNAGGAQPGAGTPSAPAPATTEQPKPEPPKPVKRTPPTPVRGIHVSGWVAGSPDLIGPLLTWAKAAGINTVVLDVKAEDGKVSWSSDVPLAIEAGANARKIGDINKLVAQMHDQGFWVAGRIVTMNDQYLYKARPAWTIPGFAGGAYSFMDPKNENVWRYNIDIARDAVRAGMDEIQFDYIRYPEKLVSGYNKDTGPELRTGAIGGFLKQAMAELKPLGVTVSADLFGLTTSVATGDDMQIGQDYRQVAEIVDYVSAMVYPSHYALGTYGIANPDRAPYETVRQSMTKALERSSGIPIEKHRPWVQDFTYPIAGALHYGPAEVTAQIKALRELGVNSFMLWDPSNKYTRGIDFTKIQS